MYAYAGNLQPYYHLARLHKYYALATIVPAQISVTLIVRRRRDLIAKTRRCESAKEELACETRALAESEIYAGTQASAHNHVNCSITSVTPRHQACHSRAGGNPEASVMLGGQGAVDSRIRGNDIEARE